MWHYLRIDHLPLGARCTFCSRELRSGKGIVVADADGQEFFAGPSCAKAHLGESDERILDVTRIALCVVVKSKRQPKRSIPSIEGGRPNPEIGAETNRRPPPPPLDKIETYVRLRAEMMADFRYHASQVLKDALAEINNAGALSEESRVRISGLMRNAERDNSVFSDANVRKAIGLEYWLKVALDHTRVGRRDFLTGMLAALHSRWQLSHAQISAVNRWGEKLRKEVDDFPMLQPDAFAGVTIPDFMQPTKKKQSN